MRRRCAPLGPADVQGRSVEVDLIPAKVGEFGHAQAVAVGDEDHGGVAVTVPLRPRGRATSACLLAGLRFVFLFLSPQHPPVLAKPRQF